MRKLFMLGVSLAVMIVPAMGAQTNALGPADGDALATEAEPTNSLATTPVQEDYEISLDVQEWAEVEWVGAPNMTYMLNAGANNQNGPQLHVAANTSVELRAFETLGSAVISTYSVPQQYVWGYPGHVEPGDFSNHIISPNLGLDLVGGSYTGGYLSQANYIGTGIGLRGIGAIVHLPYNGNITGDNSWDMGKSAGAAFNGHATFNTHLACEYRTDNGPFGNWDWTDIPAGQNIAFSLVAFVTVP